LIFDDILIDTANLFYRLKGNTKNSLDITKKLINFTEDSKKYLKKEGTLWLLFDPLSYSDLGKSKAFINDTERKKILPDYKANRKYSDLYLETIELYRKYYFYRGEFIKLVYSDEYEADDYVEPILDMNKNHKVALISNDLDWARYISDDVYLINKNFDKPFTVEEFCKTFQFYPSKCANTFYKALFGDKSDNIPGAIFIKKAKFICSDGIKMLCLQFLKYINENDLQLDDVIHTIKTQTYYKIADKKDKTPFDELCLQLKSNDLKLPMLQTLYDNIAIIRSELEGKNIDDMIHFNPENETTNSIIYQSIYGISFKNIFGRV
jgi:hypothetical protein